MSLPCNCTRTVDYEDSSWDSVGVAAASSSLPAGLSDYAMHQDTNSYVEHGGDSIQLMSTFLTLKQQGSDLTVEEFVRASLAPLSFSTALADLPAETLRYHKKPLSEIPTDAVQKLLSEAFAYRGNLGGGNFYQTPMQSINQSIKGYIALTVMRLFELASFLLRSDL